MAMEKDQNNFKILMFPWLAHGHISPFLELSKTLLKTNHFTIYLCSTPVNLDSIRANLVQGAASVELVELRMPSSPQLPPRIHTTKNLPRNLLPTLIRTFQEASNSFSEIVDTVSPDLLIYDFFQPWAPKLALKRGIPCVYFLTSAASTFSYYHHVYTKGTGASFPYKAMSASDGDIVRVREFIKPNIKDGDDDFAYGNFTRSSDIVLVKSCREIEAKYIDYLSTLSKKKIVCTGPLIVDGFNSNEEESSKIMRWLDGKEHGSTLYISFGSECFISREQIGEIAKGLMLCKFNFLWVLRFPLEAKIATMEEGLPRGFVEAVEGRGLMVPAWGPQTKILGHESVGGFVSHCGWGSVVEAMYFGVPVVAMPVTAGQPLNAQLVVESGTGVGVERGGDGVYKGEDIAKAIDKVMVEEAFYEGLRSRARTLSKAIKGKEEEDVAEVVEQLLKICVKNKSRVKY